MIPIIELIIIRTQLLLYSDNLSQRKYYWCPQNVRYFFVHHQTFKFSNFVIAILNFSSFILSFLYIVIARPTILQ